MADLKQYLPLYICAAIILLVFVTGGIITKKEKEELPSSTLDLTLDTSPTISPSEPDSMEAEPVPFAWEDYTNDKYNFSLIYPEKWFKQEYTKDTKGGLFIAFSSEPLPCEDCTYLHDGYFSVKIYNQKTDPESYAGFQQKIKALGRAEGLHPARLSGRPGIFYETTVAAENEGWVYELTLEKNDKKAEDSQIFKRVLSSFKFTNLVFTN